MDQQFQNLYSQVGRVFTPGSPVNERDLFAGRIAQLQQIMEATSQPGYHGVLYGERGVGKTSLSNVAAQINMGPGRIVCRVNCDAGDSFPSLWRKAFADVTLTQTRPGLGFGSKPSAEAITLVTTLPNELGPDDVRRVLTGIMGGTGALIIFDEFDRLNDPQTCVLMADTIKGLSDYGVDATILLIGVADSVDDLIEGHQSIERALIQIPMPRMSPSEIGEILNNGLTRLGMTIEPPAREELVNLAQGLPYIAHLLALQSARAALAGSGLAITSQHVDSGIRKALDQWQQSIKSAYYEATKSPQPGNIYREVLLACALAEVDDLGYFSAAAVRSPLKEITGKPYDIPNFARHLKDFSDEGRGRMLQRVGESRRIRYRFGSPIMKPYIVMRGFAEGLLTKKQMRKITNG